MEIKSVISLSRQRVLDRALEIVKSPLLSSFACSRAPRPWGKVGKEASWAQ